MADWLELPTDIIGLFADRLPFLEDFVSFASVCKSWRSVAIHAKTRRKPPEPWLVLAKLPNDKEEEEEEEGAAVRDFYNLSSNQLFNFSMPELQGRRCWGTQYGWIITVGLDSEFHLFNPLTKSRFSLPPKTTLLQKPYSDNERMCRNILRNFALSSNPSISGESVLVMATYGERDQLALASPKHKSWTHIKDASHAANSDVIFFKDRLYSISVQGTLRVSDTNSTPPVSIDFAPPPPMIDPCAYIYLADILGDLHMIARSYCSADADTYEDMHVYTTRFSIYKFDFHATQWIQVKDFETCSVFVGNNTTFAISASKYPQFKLKSNCIYFTDDHTEYYDNEFCDMGIYDMEKEVVIEHFCQDMGLLSNFSRPFFLMSTKID